MSAITKRPTFLKKRPTFPKFLFYTAPSCIQSYTMNKMKSFVKIVGKHRLVDHRGK